MQDPATTPAPAPTAGRAGLGKTAFALVAVLLFIGIGAASYLGWVKLQLQYHPDYISGCNVNEAINCDAVQTSDQSTIAGIPVALFGIATYAALLFLAVVARFGRRNRDMALAALSTLALATVGYCIYLAGVSIFVIKAVCTFCVLMYVVSIAVTLAAGLSLPGRFRSYLRASTWFGPLRTPFVAAGIAVSFWAAFGASYGVFAGARSALIGRYIATVPTAAPGTEQATAATAPGVTADIVPVKTNKGMSYMQFATGPGEHVKGPADAPVTIVQFADFGCGYCKEFTKKIEPLSAKYEGKIRWIFKHFPMDKACNPRFKTLHPDACKGSRAVVCADEQGKFWEAHDHFFARESRFSEDELAAMAEAIGLDRAKWDACMNSDRPDAKIARDVADGTAAALTGTPRSYVNGVLVPGNVGLEIMDYYIRRALDQGAKGAATATAPAPVSDATPRTVRLPKKDGTFYIDAFEASFVRGGKAAPIPGVAPAFASWKMASEACAASGKRLCTEEEWFSACTGAPAADDDGDGAFADDAIEGWIYPYGAFYMGGRCHDSAKDDAGRRQAAGSMAGCVSRQGVYDLAGNLAEWVVSSAGKPLLVGGHYESGQGASCSFSLDELGAGIRNEVTGFRCCSDGPPPVLAATPADSVDVPLGGEVGAPVLAFALPVDGGDAVTERTLAKGVSVVTLVKPKDPSSRNELAALERVREDLKKAGVRLFVFDVDRAPPATGGDTPAYKGTILIDRDQITMGVFSTRRLPATYLVDRKGVVQYAAPGGMSGAVDAFVPKAKELAAAR